MIRVLTAIVRDGAAILLGLILVAFLALVLLMGLQRAAQPIAENPDTAAERSAR